MTDNATDAVLGPEPMVQLGDPETVQQLTDVALRGQQLISDFVQRNSNALSALPNTMGMPGDESLDADPLGLGKLFASHFAAFAQDPERLIAAQFDWWRKSVDLWEASMRQMMGMDAQPVVPTDPSDRRFRDESWSEQFVFNYVKQTYLIGCQFFNALVAIDGQDGPTPAVAGEPLSDEERRRRKRAFFMRQFTDALSPTNFALTNPEVLKCVAETKGENLLDGLQNLLNDMEQSLRSKSGAFRIRQVDEAAFVLGDNIATTKGSVIYENELMQLIQYAPLTDQVYQRPLVIVPPWINKYYILDLREDNSFIRWAVERGHTVFVISWVNPGSELADKNFEDYMQLGVLSAIDAAFKATGERDVNLVGYCIGGTLLAATLAWMKKFSDQRVQSATFLTTMIDFSEPGDLGVFTTEEDIAYVESKMAQSGYLDGASMANTFNMLRSNDLIWSFVINNYLLGKPALKFDLLFWNSDSTRMPAAMHSFYLRSMYHDNLLCKKNGIALCGQGIDIADITTPAFFVATQEDHIAPWRSCFQGAKLFSGPLEFVLSGSGHIAGVVNPPVKNKYFHTLGGDIRQAPDPESWRAAGRRESGSWWPAWDKWLHAYAGVKVAARQPGDGSLGVIEPAPGRYCLAK